MKVLTVKEVAKKLRMCESSVYKRVKAGQISKIPNLGTTVRIPASEIKEFKELVSAGDCFTYDESKVVLIETHLGKVRKLKDKDEYVMTDLVRLLNLSDSYSITRRLDAKNYRKIESREAQKLGLHCNQFGLLLISYRGIVEYSHKSRNKHIIHFGKLLKELKVEECQKFIEEVENNTLKIFEGHEVEIIEVDGEVLFELYSTGMALGHSTTDGKSISFNGGQKLFPRKDRINAVLKRLEIKPVVIDGQLYLTEPKLFDFMLETRSAKCIPFRKWVTNEVLPTIRKTGGYVDRPNGFVDNYFTNLSADTRDIIAKELLNKNEELASRKRQMVIESEKMRLEYMSNKKLIEELERQRGGTINGINKNYRK